MTTPERKVKDRVRKLLAAHGAYSFMPATHGYGSSGVPDIVGCMEGMFIGVECKANGGRPTALQMKNLRDIEAQGGVAVLVDETGIESFANLLSLITSFEGGGFFAFLKGEVKADPETVEE